MEAFQPYPIFTLVGKKGTGKTLTMTALGIEYHVKDNLTIFANYDLFEVEYTKITFQDLAAFPDWLHNGVVLIDESHIGADAYSFFNQQTQDITKFMTQTRKRKLIIMMTTQIFTQMAKRLRLLTDYIMECERTNIEGVVHIAVYDKDNGSKLINTFFLDGRPYFKHYETEQLIMS